MENNVENASLIIIVGHFFLLQLSEDKKTIIFYNSLYEKTVGSITNQN